MKGILTTIGEIIKRGGHDPPALLRRRRDYWVRRCFVQPGFVTRVPLRRERAAATCCIYALHFDPTYTEDGDRCKLVEISKNKGSMLCTSKGIPPLDVRSGFGFPRVQFTAEGAEAAHGGAGAAQYRPAPRPPGSPLGSA
ncbi:jg25050 [Pararge aegeria aegeria]|uniref:Jg25050 protein n=1 Tax=Pararge aegeria aegeria TaxID=348720 RepID=A0A8S4QUC5_9NEOP|nr:jg25050 [Pararge aegeria aegeria]